jgi:hypothetical protein
MSTEVRRAVPVVKPRLTVRILRDETEIRTLRDEWDVWQQHPHVDLDLYLAIARVRPEVISPYVIALYRGDALETIVVGRLERSVLPLRLGYWNMGRLPVRRLSIVHGGLLGDTSEENCSAALEQIRLSLRSERAHLGSLHFIPMDSSTYQATTHGWPVLCRDYFPEVRPHWIMHLPSNISDIYQKMSPKARKNRRYEANRLLKEFPNAVRVECYSSCADLDRVFDHAETIARHTYQRGLGVGFVSNDENRIRFRIEAERGRFRAYFLYLDDKPVAFFLGTLHKNVLYDNFTAYDPEYSKYSPGMFLFFQIFERACNERVHAVDFGFGDAWYKSHFGTSKHDEATVALFAPSSRGIALNMFRSPVLLADYVGRKAFDNLNVLRSVKKHFRDRAQKRAQSGATE